MPLKDNNQGASGASVWAEVSNRAKDLANLQPHLVVLINSSHKQVLCLAQEEMMEFMLVRKTKLLYQFKSRRASATLSLNKSAKVKPISPSLAGMVTYL